MSTIRVCATNPYLYLVRIQSDHGQQHVSVSEEVLISYPNHVNAKFLRELRKLDFFEKVAVGGEMDTELDQVLSTPRGYSHQLFYKIKIVSRG